MLLLNENPTAIALLKAIYNIPNTQCGLWSIINVSQSVNDLLLCLKEDDSLCCMIPDFLIEVLSDEIALLETC